MKKLIIVLAILFISTNVYARQKWNELSRIIPVKVVRITIGNVLSTGETYKFTSAGNVNEQVITCTNILPAFARMVNSVLINTSASVFTGGATTLEAEIGTTSSGAQIAASSTIYALNSFNEGTNDADVSTSATTLYISATPGANWNTMTAGKWVFLLYYLDNSMSM